MCQLNASARISASAKSLALIRPRKVTDLRIERHPGWTAEEEKKITNYVSQLDLLSEDRAPKTPLEAPRFRGTYHYLCGEPTCRGHKQGVLDWEFVALQRTLSYLDDESLVRELRTKFLDMMCSPDKDTAFYVGNQAKRAHVFSVLGVYYPKKA
jgi:hypothetical protein